MRYYLFVVEGAHDIAIIEKNLKLLGVNTAIKRYEDLHSLWKKFIPDKFPFKEDNLDRITPIPSFFENSEVSIAIKSAGGDEELFPTLIEMLEVLDMEELDKIEAVMVVLDADTKGPRVKVENLINKSTSSEDIKIMMDNEGRMWIQTIVKNIELQTYAFPNNDGNGNLEDLLVEIAGYAYPDLLTDAVAYVSDVDEKYKKVKNSSGKNKAIIGCITNILKPGKANQVSISDNDWISNLTINECKNVEKLHLQIKSFLRG